MVTKQSDLLEALEQAILQALRDTEGKERNDAVSNGIKLLAIKHRIRGGTDDADYFGSASGGG